MEVAIGDHFVIKGKKFGQARRNGEVVEVLGSLFSPRQHFRVRWGDGQETIYVPGPGVTIHRKDGTDRTIARQGLVQTRPDVRLLFDHGGGHRRRRLPRSSTLRDRARILQGLLPRGKVQPAGPSGIPWRRE